MGAEMIYHYTDARGLLGILSGSELWLTDVMFLNDREELAYSAAVIREQIEKRIESLRPQIKGPMGGDPIGSQVSVLSGLLENLDPEHLRGDSSLYAHVACFCKDGDLLSQWRGYSGGVGGFAIGFDPELLQPDSASWDGPVLRDVQYGLAEAKELIDGVLTSFAPHPTGHPGVNAEVQAAQALPVLARIKHPGFREEQEVRLIVASTGQPGDVQFRVGQHGVVPYRSHKFRPEAIREIVDDIFLPLVKSLRTDSE